MDDRGNEGRDELYLALNFDVSGSGSGRPYQKAQSFQEEVTHDPNVPAMSGEVGMVTLAMAVIHESLDQL